MQTRIKGSEYVKVHRWIYETAGKACCCMLCGVKNAKQYQWSNKSREYKYDLEDWWQLCVPCHKKYDMTDETRKKMSLSRMGVSPWNKGKKGKQENHNTNGLLRGGWNKGNRMRQNRKCTCGNEFHPRLDTSKYCSIECSVKALHARRKEIATKASHSRGKLSTN